MIGPNLLCPGDSEQPEHQNGSDQTKHLLALGTTSKARFRATESSRFAAAKTRSVQETMTIIPDALTQTLAIRRIFLYP